jgi:hypothetical protein
VMQSLDRKEKVSIVIEKQEPLQKKREVTATYDPPTSLTRLSRWRRILATRRPEKAVTGTRVR